MFPFFSPSRVKLQTSDDRPPSLARSLASLPETMSSSLHHTDITHIFLSSISSRKSGLQWKNPPPRKHLFPFSVFMIQDSELRQPLSRKIPMSASMINPYRVIILFRLVILAFFLRYRLTHPVKNAHGLWLASVLCEVWFALFWIIDQLPKLLPVNRRTYPERLCLRYNKPGKPSELPCIDIFVGTADPLKEPPLVTANTILSILSVDYPAEKVSCYVSDDGAALVTLETLLETCEFAKKWVPFSKKFSIEPRSPECYFSQKVDRLKFNTFPTFFKERRLMKRQYEEFKLRINGLVARFQTVPPGGWSMKDGTPWPGNNAGDHPGLIQILLGHGSEALPQLVYVSRERRPGFQHHKKAGAMNALVRVSALLTNGAYILNLDCNHYINNSQALLEAMCFMMGRRNRKKVSYVQFPLRFDGINANNRYADHNTVFYDGPLYVGSGCFLSRKALYGYDAPLEPLACQENQLAPMKFSSVDNHVSFNSTPVVDESRSRLLVDSSNLEMESHPEFLSMEKCFGQSQLLLASNLVNDDSFTESVSPNEILREAVHVISYDYEDNTAWGIEIGWIYGCQTGDILTGFKMHTRGWRSIYCMPQRAAFRGSAPISLSDRLSQVLLWAVGSIEILFSRHCPIWYGYGGRLKWLERIAYINNTIYPLASFPLLIYCTLPAICLVTGKFIIPMDSIQASVWLGILIISIWANGVLEIRWSGVNIQEWWRNQQFWLIAGVSSHLFAVFQGLTKVVLGFKPSSRLITKTSTVDNSMEFYSFKWTSLLILPTTLIFINLWAVFIGISSAVGGDPGSWRFLFAKLFFAFLVIIHLHPLLKGLLVRKCQMPTVVIVWSVLLTALFSVLWLRLDPFTIRFRGPDVKDCGIEC
ncbi:probable cellulose synthase A catalytic subunit 8 [UDP-forming] isoform X2 [Macadamia integrifolia]|uniref:probable cellulose synthase A catalytic subunit 8 [UDP-forming] isoform X2 n=1 Tax=Macadamia integrifolia TaxID=60698 RepID=UPI001C52C071|nr:probable cellulose synthase A catalytic subunit 8 [UDP-forming] isoform X2 [Macadamia integrifolia]